MDGQAIEDWEVFYTIKWSTRSERDLETYERIAVEDRATEILNKLAEMPEAQASLGPPEPVEYTNHENGLSDQDEEVQAHLKPPYADSKMWYGFVTRF